jgi:hypothetical protein
MVYMYSCASFPPYSMISLNKTEMRQVRSFQHRMNRRGGSSSSDSPWVQDRDRAGGSEDLCTWWTDGVCISSSDGLEEANNKVLAAKSSALDEPTVRRCKHQMNCVTGHARWRQWLVALDEPTPGKTIASDHPMVLVSAAFSQRLIWFLRLFILLAPRHPSA